MSHYYYKPYKTEVMNLFLCTNNALYEGFIFNINSYVNISIILFLLNQLQIYTRQASYRLSHASALNLGCGLPLQYAFLFNFLLLYCGINIDKFEEILIEDWSANMH